MRRVLLPLLALALLSGALAWRVLHEPDGGASVEAPLHRVTSAASEPPAPIGIQPGLQPVRADTPTPRPAPLVRVVWPTDDALLASLQLAGVVLRAGDDVPLPRVEVVALADMPGMREPPAIGETSTGPDGRFSLADTVVARRPHTLIFSWAEEWLLDDDLQLDDEKDWFGYGLPRPDKTTYVLPLVEAQGSLDALVVRLTAGWVARGQVVDAAGRPLAGARVRSRAAETTADRDGRFSLSGPRTSGRARIAVTRKRLMFWRPPDGWVLDDEDAEYAYAPSPMSLSALLAAPAVVREFRILEAGQSIDLGRLVPAD